MVDFCDHLTLHPKVRELQSEARAGKRYFPMVCKGVQGQFERGLSAKVAIANLAAAKPVPALAVPRDTIRRDRASLGIYNYRYKYLFSSLGLGTTTAGQDINVC
jgi:hypothetical protein